MSRRPGAALLLLCAALLGPLAPPAGAAAADPVRIMPLGDSLTGSPGCWRALLWQDLVAAGAAPFDFVGNEPVRDCGFAYDAEHQGISGLRATDLAADGRLPGWLAATRPGVVLMHLGTNDVWNGLPTAAILDAFTVLLDQLRAADPSVRLLVAQILPMAPNGCPTCGERVVELNAAIPGWAAERSTAASPVTVVDQWTGFATGTDTRDGVHPNDAGTRKIADAWYPAVAEVLAGTA